jgi:DNA repair exonuclease SbcCD ATPase subunit
MKEIRLKTLNLKNFKGIHNFVLDAQGKNTCIFGENATGKSSLFDSFLWILFGKNSQWQNQFEIKPLNADGEPIHGVESSVEIVLDVNGETSVLKKIYREVWQKKRGSATAEFTGHTTDHFVDGVPVQKKEYDARIAEIANENIFRLLTDPRYFNEILHWQKRRELLLEVCGDVSDAEVIASKKELAKLGDILGSRTIEQHRKVIQVRRSEINKELERIPVRIDEVERGLPRVDDITKPEELPNDIAKLREELRAKQEELAQAKAGGQVAGLTKRLREVEGQIIEEKNRLAGELTEKVDTKRQEIWVVGSVINKVKTNIDRFELEAKSTQVEIGNLEEKVAKLRADWHAENAKEFVFEQSETCPTCGQALPAEQLEEARGKALAEFNRQKAERLEAITHDGKMLAARKTELEAQLKEILQERDQLAAKLPELEQKKAALQEELQTLQDGLRNTEPSPEYIELQKQCEELKEQIREAQEDTGAAVAEVQKEINIITSAITALEQAAARLEARKSGLKRIEELKAEERKLATEYEELEQQLYLTEEFIRAKVRLLEDKINSKFKMARFKLFDVQVNGALSECCETTFNGVPYSNLNNGARLNIGLDIINTLAEHYDFAPPVWLDNAESVTDILQTKGQQIRLIVSGMDKNLRIEIAEREELKEVV